MVEDADVDVTDPHWKTRAYDEMQAYGSSKLAMLLHARELAEKHQDIKAVALHPGWGDSDLQRTRPCIMTCCVLPCCMKMCLGKIISLEAAAQVYLYCIISDDIETGKFYSNKGIYGDETMQKGGMPMEFKSKNATPEKQKAVWDWAAKEMAPFMEASPEGAAEPARNPNPNPNHNCRGCIIE